MLLTRQLAVGDVLIPLKFSGRRIRCYAARNTRSGPVSSRDSAKMPPRGRYKILCVAEKNSISKAVTGHLSGGQFTTVSWAIL